MWFCRVFRGEARSREGCFTVSVCKWIWNILISRFSVIYQLLVLSLVHLGLLGCIGNIRHSPCNTTKAMKRQNKSSVSTCLDTSAEPFPLTTALQVDFVLELLQPPPQTLVLPLGPGCFLLVLPHRLSHHLQNLLHRATQQLLHSDIQTLNFGHCFELRGKQIWKHY